MKNHRSHVSGEARCKHLLQRTVDKRAEELKRLKTELRVAEASRPTGRRLST